MTIKPIRVPIIATNNYSVAIGRFSREIDRLASPIKRIGDVGSGVTKKIGELFSTTAKIGIAGVGASIGLFAIAKSSNEMADDLYNLSGRIGINIEALQELRWAARQTDMDLETFDKSMIVLGRNSANAAAGVNMNKDVFNALGVKVTDTAGRMRPLEEIFSDVVDQVEKLPDPLTKSRVVFALFGKQGGQMMQMMRGGNKEIQKFREQARKFGLINEKDIEASGKFIESYRSMTQAFNMSKFRIGANLFPVLEKLSKSLTDKIIEKRPQIEAFASSLADKLPGAIATVTAVASELYDKLSPIAGLFVDITKAIGPTNTILGIAAFKIGGPLVGAIGALSKALAALNISIGTSPLAIAIGGLAAFGAAVMATYNHFKDLNKEYEDLNRMRVKFGDGKATIKTIEDVNNEKINRLKSLYDKALINPNGWTKEDDSAIKDIERELTKQGFDFSGDYKEKQQRINEYWEKVPGNVNFGNLNLNPKPQKLDLNINFSNLPPGTRANVKNPSKIPLNLNMGYSNPDSLVY